MVERFGPEQLEVMIRSSKRFEHVWRVYTHWGDYSQEEVEKERNFLNEQMDNYVAMAKLNPGSAEIFERITMGIYHIPEIQKPPELAYKIRLN